MSNLRKVVTTEELYSRLGVSDPNAFNFEDKGIDKCPKCGKPFKITKVEGRIIRACLCKKDVTG